MTTPLQDQCAAHIALAATADEIVQAFAAKANELAASEAALRSACITSAPGSTTFAKAGQTNLAGYLVTLAERIAAGERRPEMLKPVGTLAAEAWQGVQ